MKPFRLVFIGLAGVLLLVVVAAIVVFNSSFQTWLVRRTLAAHPEYRASVGSVSAGLKRVALRNVRVERDAVVLTVPALEADLPLLSAALGNKVTVSRLVATGWTLDLSATGGAAQPGKVDPATAAAQAFAGVFALLDLPVDLAVDGVQLAGETILPAQRGRGKVSFQGGGLGEGREGKFDLDGTFTLADRAVDTLGVRGTLAVTMDTPRTFTRVAARIDASAKGEQFPAGVKLAADISAARAASGETYAVTVVGDGRPLLAAQATLPARAKQIDGTWRVDVRDTDLAPFALGRPLPTFTVSGEGKFETDASFASVHGSGKLDAAADRLQVLRPELASVGAIRLGADFDLAQRGRALVVERLNATLTGARPIAQVEALQPFTLDLESRKLETGDAARDLLGIALQGLPLAWARPFLRDVTLEGGDLRGELIASARGGGVTLRSKGPLALAGLSVAQPNQPLLTAIDVAFDISADYAPEGWQAEIAGFTAKSGRTPLLTLEARAGQLAGGREALKATGRAVVYAAPLSGQPLARGGLPLIDGEASVEFVASLGAKREMQARLALRNLAADPQVTKEKLPTISAEVRADLGAEGRMELHAPIAIERDGRKSDLAVGGVFSRGKDGLALDAQVSSTNLVVDDAKVLAALFPTEKPADPATKTAPAATAAPPWAGVTGTVELALKKVVYSDSFQASDVTGTLRIQGGTLKLERGRAGLNEGGEVKVNGTVNFDARAPQPYGLAADLALTEFDPGPLFRAIAPGQPATVEGKFNVISRLAAHALTLGDLALGAGGDFQLTSHGGVFRGLPVNVAAKLESAGTIAAGIAKLGSLASALGGKSDRNLDNVASKAQAVAELVNFWKAIGYDQLSVSVSRDAALNTVLKDFTLISPELRLSGGGQATHRAGAPLLDETLAMEFKLRARGRNAELLKYLGALETETDDLGYATCTLPLKVGGTLGKPDTSELNQRLMTLALEKSGVTEKAADLFNKLMGNGK